MGESGEVGLVRIRHIPGSPDPEPLSGCLLSTTRGLLFSWRAGNQLEERADTSSPITLLLVGPNSAPPFCTSAFLPPEPPDRCPPCRATAAIQRLWLTLHGWAELGSHVIQRHSLVPTLHHL